VVGSHGLRFTPSRVLPRLPKSLLPHSSRSHCVYYVSLPARRTALAFPAFLSPAVCFCLRSWLRLSCRFRTVHFHRVYKHDFGCFIVHFAAVLSFCRLHSVLHSWFHVSFGWVRSYGLFFSPHAHLRIHHIVLTFTWFTRATTFLVHAHGPVAWFTHHAHGYTHVCGSSPLRSRTPARTYLRCTRFAAVLVLVYGSASFAHRARVRLFCAVFCASVRTACGSLVWF